MRQSSAKAWFLTYPRCDVHPDGLLPLLLQHLPPIEWCVIARETHEDGGYHLHVALMFEKPYRSRTMREFDAVTGKHGDYQVMKSVVGSLRYLWKEDPAPVEYGPVPEFSTGSVMRKRTISNVIAEAIMRGASLDEVNEDHPGFVMMNKRKLEEYLAWRATTASTEAKRPWPGVTYDGPCEKTRTCVDWLVRNIRQQREFKQPQLWLCGPPNSRKTTLCRRLEEFCTVYWLPNSELFYDGFDDSVQLIAADEFRHGKPCEWLNLLLEGSTMMMRRKGQAAVLKRNNPPVIICSNYEPVQIYGDPMDLQCLQARLQVVTLYGPLDIDNVKFG